MCYIMKTMVGEAVCAEQLQSWHRLHTTVLVYLPNTYRNLQILTYMYNVNELTKFFFPDLDG